MNRLNELLALPEPERLRRGLMDTPREIAHQPEAWRKTAEIVLQQAPSLNTFRPEQLVFAGAGTSHFIGLSLMGMYRRLGRHAEAIASTEITIDPHDSLPPGNFGLVSFARSGNSPDSNHAFELVSRLRPDAPHVVVTCNPEGKLFQLAGEHRRAVTLLLPAMTNDRGLAMTSSYTSMVVAGQGMALADQPHLFVANVHRMAEIAQSVLEVYPTMLAEVAARKPRRALFLGTGTLLGAATEAHLKVQEMTAGKVLARADSFLGLRHGPMAFVDDETLIVAFLSSQSGRRRYELDLLREVREKRLGMVTVAVSDNGNDLAGLTDITIEVDKAANQPLPDDVRPPVYVVVAQLLALFLSLETGLSPDNPSSGVINRVVQGVTIYAE